MPAQKTITLSFPSNTDGHLTHQVRNLGEELYCKIEQTGLGDLGGVETGDSAVGEIVISVKHRRKVSRVRSLVAKIVKAHLLSDRAETVYS
ncbi:MAG: hypothetical protein GY947_03955 [Rhodobacteraceae bacterium]|nr:hypothetical protein [Paracoccaceae bacterium]